MKLNRLKFKILLLYFLLILSVFPPSNFMRIHNPAKSESSISFNDSILKLSDGEAMPINYSGNTRKRCFFDMTHQQVFSIWDTGCMGYSEFNILLQSYYIEVSTITSSLIDNIKNMTFNDILFLNVAKYGRYTSDEISNITDFVARGGKLMIMGEHYVNNFTEFQNPLLQQFDMELTKDEVSDIKNYVIHEVWNIFNCSFFNLFNLSIMLGAVINVHGNAFSIANTSSDANFPNKPIMTGYNNSNGGKVFCCSDSEWLWNCPPSFPGIKYGNNSKLILKILDWFYDSNLSEEIELGNIIIPEYKLFSAPKHSIFKLNMSLPKEYNISTNIVGGDVFPKYAENLVGNTAWNINLSDNGYIEFIFNNTALKDNFSFLVYFFAQNNTQNKILILQNEYSRSVDPSPDGLLKFAFELCHNRNYSVYAANKILNYSNFKCIIIANPLREYNSEIIESLNQSTIYGTRLIFFNCPHSSLDMEDPMALYMKLLGIPSDNVPINKISELFGIKFIRYMIGDDTNNINNTLFYPKLLSANYTFYNISCYMPAIINITKEGFTNELLGYPTAWGEYRTIFGTAGWMGYHIYDINDTLVMAYNNKTLGTGILNYFINDYFETNNYFNDYFFYWIERGVFNKKYLLQCNQTEFYYENVDFRLSSAEKIRDINGNVVPNGTIFNVEIAKGEIKTEDAEPFIPGFQIKAYNGSINLTCNSKSDIGFCEISIYNTTQFKIILSILLNFSSIPLLYIIQTNPSPNGNLTLHWRNIQSAETYYIYRSNQYIYSLTGLSWIDKVSTNIYRDNLTSFGIYYYVIVGSDYLRNTSISNCVSITIYPIIQIVSQNPNHDGNIRLIWDPLIGAKTYYILRYYSEITNQTYKDPFVRILANITGCSYTDNIDLVQGNTYYYAIFGSDYIKNSSVSNCLTAIMNFVPKPPAFISLNLKVDQKNVFVSWDSILYAFEYAIYLSSDGGFNPSETNLLRITPENYISIENLNDGTYYLRVKAIGQYGNSSYSEELIIEIEIIIEVEPDDPTLLLSIIFGILLISTIIIFSYFWIYFKKQEFFLNSKKNEKKKTNF